MGKSSSIKTVNTIKSIKSKAKGFFRRLSKNSGADDTKSIKFKTPRHSEDRSAYPATGAHPASRSSMTLAENFNYEDHKPTPYEDECQQTVLADIPADAMSVHRDVEPVWSFGAADGRMMQLEELNQHLLEEYFHDRELNGITVRDANFPERYVTIHLREACTCDPRSSHKVSDDAPSSSSTSTSPETPHPPQILHLGRDCHRQFLPVWRFEHRGQWRRFDESNQIHLETVFGYRNHQKILDPNFPGQRMLVKIHSDDPKISFKGVMTFLPPEVVEKTQEPTQEPNGHGPKKRNSIKRLLKRSPSISTL